MFGKLNGNEAKIFSQEDKTNLYMSIKLKLTVKS